MKSTPPYKPKSVRQDYIDGVWTYALGKPATEHDDYESMLKRVERSGKFDPWWIRTWQDVEAVKHGCWFDEGAGKRVCKFFEKYLRHTKAGIGKNAVSGRPVRLMDWQKWDLTYPIFGWMRQDGRRRFTRAGIWVPKKNAKSFWCSGIGLYFLTCDGVDSAEVYAAAGSRDQAGIIHDEAAKMVQSSPKLASILDCVPHKKTIFYREAMSRFLALSSESSLQEGLNGSATLFDEVHTQKDAVYFDTLVFNGISRPESMLIEISTAGVYDPLSIGYLEYDKCLHIHNGDVVNWQYYTYIACAEKDEDIGDPAIQKKANPGIDITISAEELAETVRVALDNPRDINSVRRYRFNQWTHTRDRLLDLNRWSECKTALSLDAQKELLIGRACYGGLDLSLSNDLTAFAMWFPPLTPEDKHVILIDFFLPRANIDALEQSTRAPYRDWADNGFIHLTDGPVVDYAYVRDVIEEHTKKYKIQQIGFDPWNATETSSELIRRHGEEFMVEVRQGQSTMAPATKFTCDLITSGRIIQPNHEILNWHAGNAQATYDRNGNFWVVKSDGKIRFKVDGFVACVIAGARVLVAPAPKKRSVYETRGLVSAL